jgi:hypothetical protein
LDTVTEKAQFLAQKAVIGWVSDPSHGWLAVNYSAIDGFSNALQFASHFSYIDESEKLVYLEEDDDAPRFIRRYNLDGRAWQGYTLPDENEIRELPRGFADVEKMDKGFIDEHFKIITVA